MMSPYDHSRCDKQQCRIGKTCNIIALLITMLLISGLAQAF